MDKNLGFNCSFIHSFGQVVTHSPIPSPTHPSPISQPLSRSITQAFSHSLTHSLTHSLAHTYSSIIRLLIHSHSHTHILTQSHTHLLGDPRRRWRITSQYMYKIKTTLYNLFIGYSYLKRNKILAYERIRYQNKVPSRWRINFIGSRL